MPLQSDSLIVEVEIYDLYLSVAHMYVQCICVPLAGYILLMTPQLEVLKHLGHENFDDNRSAELKWFFHLLLFGMIIIIIIIIIIIALQHSEDLDRVNEGQKLVLNEDEN